MTKNSMTIEDKIKQLEGQVSWFDSDDFKIEQAIEKYNQAKVLAQDITNDIDQMKNEITVINEN
jgi:exonuclease VII small subunit